MFASDANFVRKTIGSAGCHSPRTPKTETKNPLSEHRQWIVILSQGGAAFATVSSKPVEKIRCLLGYESVTPAIASAFIPALVSVFSVPSTATAGRCQFFFFDVGSVGVI